MQEQLPRRQLFVAQPFGIRWMNVTVVKFEIRIHIETS